MRREGAIFVFIVSIVAFVYCILFIFLWDRVQGTTIDFGNEYSVSNVRNEVGTRSQETINEEFPEKSPGIISLEAKAFRYIDNILKDCSNSYVIVKPTDDVGLGLAFTEILQLVNVVIAKGDTPRIDPSSAIWFSGKEVTVEDTLFLPCRLSEDKEESAKVLRCTGICPAPDTARRVWVPPEFVFMGYKWWYKQLARAVIRPTTKLLNSLHQTDALQKSSVVNKNFKVELVEQSIRQDPISDESVEKYVRSSPFDSLFNTSNLEKPLIGVHLRKGDSCTEIRPQCIRKIRVVLELLRAKGFSSGTLVVASESESLLADLMSLYREYGFSGFINFSIDRSLYMDLQDKHTLPIEDHPELSNKIKDSNLVLEALLDVALLSVADVHVGSFFSNFIRIGLSLAPNPRVLTPSNLNPRYITFDAYFCPFESCNLGWLSHRFCPRWHKHLCQWRPKNICSNPDQPELVVKKCSLLAGSSCSLDCFMFTLSKRAYRMMEKPLTSLLPPRQLRSDVILDNQDFYNLIRVNIKEDADFPINIRDIKKSLLQGSVHSESSDEDSRFWKSQVAFLTFPLNFMNRERLKDIFVSDDICCTRECRSDSFSYHNDYKAYAPACYNVSQKLNEISRFLDEEVYDNKVPLFLENIKNFYSKQQEDEIVFEKAPPCDDRFMIIGNDKDRKKAIKRAEYNVFTKVGSENLETIYNSVPAADCAEKHKVPNFKNLRARIKKSTSAIVLLAQKKHSSYKRDSLGPLKLALKTIYANFNDKFHYDVLLFHEGDFSEDDILGIRNFEDSEKFDIMSRQEINLVKVEGKFWELPGHISKSNPKVWTDDQFSVGYRHMCRWYSGMLFEFVHRLGYEYVMRFDEDSILLSPIDYDIFDHMKRNDLEYGFRNDAIEPCCDSRIRKMMIDKLTVVMENKGKSGFYDKVERYTKKHQQARGLYGIYNNFFITKVSFWMQPRIRRAFNFVDWTGAFYLYRENDIFFQTFAVHFFMPLHKVKKFTDFSYQHITGSSRGNCEWGTIVRGLPSYGGKSTEIDAALTNFNLKHDSNLEHYAFEGERKQLVGIYCDKINLEADVHVNFHGSLQDAAAKVFAEGGCADTTYFKVINTLIDGPINFVRRDQGILLSETTNFDSKKAAAKYQQLLEKVASDCDPETATEDYLFLEAPECGGGCTIDFLVQPFMYAMKHDLRIVTPGSLWLGRSGRDQCGSNKDLSCFLKPFASSESCGGTPAHSRSKDGTWRRINQDDIPFFSAISPMDDLEVAFLEEFQQFGTFWNVAQILRFIMRPSDLLQKRIMKVLEREGILNKELHPILAVHIRLGDACSDPKKHEKGRSCGGLEEYMPYIRDMVDTFGYKSIYLATDSNEVIKQVQQEKPLGLKWFFNSKIDRTRYNVFDEAAENDELSIEGVLFGNKKLMAAGFDPFHEMLDFLIDIFIMSDYTEGLVGKFTSNMDRIVGSLQSTANGEDSCLKPVVSIDSSWCLNFGVRSGKSYNGRTFFC